VPYCILSCDGGGIRGLLPALLIQQLSTDIPSFHGNVDLFAGTSAGALVSLGLASGVPPADIVSLFQKDGDQIFLPFSNSVSATSSASQLNAAPGSSESWPDWVTDHLNEILQGLLYVKYTNKGLQQLLRNLLPAVPLSQLPGRVLVTTFQLNSPSTGSWAPITISNFSDDPSAITFPVDAGLSTSAAPTYFPPYLHPTLGYCVDGGVYANNPGSMAIAAALASGVALADIVMLSVGTGANPESITVIPPPTNYGPLLWMLPFSYGSTPATPIVSMLTDGVASADAFICQQILGNNFLRLQVPLTSAVKMDDYQAVPQLNTSAAAFMNSEAWTRGERWVSSMFV
jgi:predicted acylesterase/phospholipase RssA